EARDDDLLPVIVRIDDQLLRLKCRPIRDIDPPRPALERRPGKPLPHRRGDEPRRERIGDDLLDRKPRRGLCLLRMHRHAYHRNRDRQKDDSSPHGTPPKEAFYRPTRFRSIFFRPWSWAQASRGLAAISSTRGTAVGVAVTSMALR